MAFDLRDCAIDRGIVIQEMRVTKSLLLPAWTWDWECSLHSLRLLRKLCFLSTHRRYSLDRAESNSSRNFLPKSMVTDQRDEVSTMTYELIFACASRPFSRTLERSVDREELSKMEWFGFDCVVNAGVSNWKRTESCTRFSVQLVSHFFNEDR